MTERKFNNRIENLAEESGMTRYVAANNKYLEQFARLIIRDCVDILSGYRGQVSWMNEETLHNHPIFEIKKRFGIQP